MADYRISFQLYSARNEPPLAAQLEALAAIGFDAVESYGGAHSADPAGFRRQLDAVGLACPTAHIALAEFDADLGKVIDLSRTLGLETAIVPWLAPDDRPKDAAGWKAIGTRVAGYAERLAKEGLGLAWHNHDFEYAKLPDGTVGVDHLLQGSVKYEMDIGWTIRAGVDPAATIRRLNGKLAAFHIKDLNRNPAAEDGWANAGDGTFDWPRLLPEIEKSGVKLLVLEHDNPPSYKAFASRSYAYVAKLIGRA